MAADREAPRELAEELGTQLGRRVHSLRKRSRLTLSEVSQRTGVSIAMLSMIERGRSHPSIGTLHAIAAALGLPMSELFHTIDTASVDGAERVVIRAEEQEVIRVGNGVERRVIQSDRARGVEMAENRYEPGTESAPTPVHHEGFEYGFVLEGRLEVTVDGRPHIVRAGDAVRLDSSRPHRFFNPGPHHARTLWINLGGSRPELTRPKTPHKDKERS